MINCNQRSKQVMPHTYNLRPIEQRVKQNIDSDIGKDVVNVTVKLLNGKQYQLHINRDTKLEELYKLVSEKTYIPSLDFYFVKQNRIMPKVEEIESWMTIRDFNFGNDITSTSITNDMSTPKDKPIDIKLHLVLRLGGRIKKFVYDRKDWFIFE